MPEVAGIEGVNPLASLGPGHFGVNGVVGRSSANSALGSRADQIEESLVPEVVDFELGGAVRDHLRRVAWIDLQPAIARERREGFGKRVAGRVPAPCEKFVGLLKFPAVQQTGLHQNRCVEEVPHR